MSLRTFVLAAAVVLGGPPVLACTSAGKSAVDAVYPSAPLVPENMLRFYLYFSAPMSDADVLPYLTLKRADGVVIEGAFLSNRFDLWSPNRTRLTVLFDPGRVKTGLDAHEALGRALTAGETYELSLDRQIKDAKGCALAEAFSHVFAVGPADFDPPDPGEWQIEAPAVGSTDPVIVRLGNSHDHLSMAYRIRVRDAEGAALPGHIELAEAESIWTFHPRAPWAGVDYYLSVDDQLEDLAGNRPGRLFDQTIGTTLKLPILRKSFRPVAR